MKTKEEQASHKTYELAVQHIVDLLDDDNFQDVLELCIAAEHPIDTSYVDADVLLVDVRIKEAFKKFIADVVSQFDDVRSNIEDEKLVEQPPSTSDN